MRSFLYFDRTEPRLLLSVMIHLHYYKRLHRPLRPVQFISRGQKIPGDMNGQRRVLVLPNLRLLQLSLNSDAIYPKYGTQTCTSPLVQFRVLRRHQTLVVTHTPEALVSVSVSVLLSLRPYKSTPYYREIKETSISFMTNPTKEKKTTLKEL